MIASLYNNFEFLQVLWWVLVGTVLIIYASTAGFDFGATMMMPFLKKEQDRKVVLNAVAPAWDGNQTWLVFAGGGLFVIYPTIYGAVFSGIYAGMLIVLWSFFLRPPGFDYRSKINSNTWRRTWDWALFLSAFLPALAFGLVFGNLLQGLPIVVDPISYRSSYDGNFFGLINPLGLLCGVTAIVMFLMHGAAHLNRRCEGALKIKMRSLHRLFGIMLLILFTIGGIMIATSVNGYELIKSPTNATAQVLQNTLTVAPGAWWKGMIAQPWKFAGPVLAYAGIIIALMTSRVGRGAMSFWAGVFATAGIVATVGLTLFPFIVPFKHIVAENYIGGGFTVWNSSSLLPTLQIMLPIVAILLSIILVYKIFAYRTIWSKKQTINYDDIKDDHTAY